MKRILSCGCGVQSSTILLMSIHGELPPLDAVIFADTGDEPRSVYEWSNFLRSKAKDAGIAWIDTKATYGIGDAQSLSEHVLDGIKHGKRIDNPPLFVIGKDGKGSIINRSCTSNWKIKPIEKATRRILGLKKGQRWPKTLAAETWVGISADEMQRMKASTVAWQRFWHPLIEAPWRDDGAFAPFRERPMKRGDCLRWMKDHGYPEPPRSACWHCPFRSNSEWRKMRDEEPEEWAKAVAFDREIRNYEEDKGLLRSGPPFVHRSLKPLDEVDLGGNEPSLFDEECGGVCGV